MTSPNQNPTSQPIYTQPAFWVTVITDALAVAAFITTTAGKNFPTVPDAVISSAAFLVATVVSAFFVHGQQQITKARLALNAVQLKAPDVAEGSPAALTIHL